MFKKRYIEYKALNGPIDRGNLNKLSAQLLLGYLLTEYNNPLNELKSLYSSGFITTEQYTKASSVLKMLEVCR